MAWLIMKNNMLVKKTVTVIEKQPKLYQDFLIFRYVNGFSNEDIGILLDVSQDEVCKIFLCAELIVRLTVEKGEQTELPDDVMKEAVEIVLKNWAREFLDDGDCGEWQPSEEFERKIRAIYMDEDTEAISKNEMLN